MENKNNGQNGFSYSYSAKEQAELKKIREKYTAKPDREEDKMTKLRRLDASVSGFAQAVALVFGIIGALILGTGMSLCMTELGDFFSSDHDAVMVVGIIIGVVGGIVASLAYPVYNFVLKRRREKLAPEILRLTDELMK